MNFRVVANLSLYDFYDLFRPANGNSISIFFKNFQAPLPNEYLIWVNDASDEDNEPWFVLTNHRVLQKNGIDKVFHQIWLKDIARIETSGIWTKKLTYHLKSGDTIIFEKVGIYVSEEYVEKLMSLEV
ncbi:hypothetical protein KORDIASMS9_04652 [Kordia sp. SMS9]|uniref:hypothetical protein n=1 Tax=Kordia sp. SMS9 TaxID=2282170 RepID=UPI000E0CEB48|nr:hypothetical protein [Kordia sp. SMS9]AXG72380.1 hypothetical protein KORDIASMS9_04652 [Kordia sp. SMS9]